VFEKVTIDRVKNTKVKKKAKTGGKRYQKGETKDINADTEEMRRKISGKNEIMYRENGRKFGAKRSGARRGGEKTTIL